MSSARTFLAWKEGEEREDCQDSIYPAPATGNLESEAGAYAISDGATTSFFSRNWARILTGRFGEDPERIFKDWNTWLKDAQSEWRKEIEEAAESGTASFFTVNGLHAKRPAAATFVGLKIAPSNSGDGWEWRARVLGDSCLFRLTSNGALTSWKIQSSSEFTSIVEALESWPRPDSHSPLELGSLPFGDQPKICSGDNFILSTDALAKWLLTNHENETPVWGTLFRLQTDDDFQAFVKQARLEADNPLANDDVALAVLNFGNIQPDFSDQIFTPKPRPEEPPGPNVTRPVLSRSPEKSSAVPFQTTLQPVLPRRREGISLWIYERIIPAVLVIVLFVLAISFRQLKRENEQLRDQLGAATRQRGPEKSAQSRADQLVKENDALKRRLRNVENQRDHNLNPETTVTQTQPPSAASSSPRASPPTKNPNPATAVTQTQAPPAPLPLSTASSPTNTPYLGTRYLIGPFSVHRKTGIVGILTGTQVTLLSVGDKNRVRTADGIEFEVSTDKLTKNLDRANKAGNDPETRVDELRREP